MDDIDKEMKAYKNDSKSDFEDVISDYKNVDSRAYYKHTADAEKSAEQHTHGVDYSRPR